MMAMFNPSHPGKGIKDDLDALDLTAAEAAKTFGVSCQRLHRVLGPLTFPVEPPVWTVHIRPRTQPERRYGQPGTEPWKGAGTDLRNGCGGWSGSFRRAVRATPGSRRRTAAPSSGPSSGGRGLPGRFGKRNGVSRHYRSWIKKGVTERIPGALPGGSRPGAPVRGRRRDAGTPEGGGRKGQPGRTASDAPAEAWPTRPATPWTPWSCRAVAIRCDRKKPGFRATIPPAAAVIAAR